MAENPSEGVQKSMPAKKFINDSAEVIEEMVQGSDPPPASSVRIEDSSTTPPIDVTFLDRKSCGDPTARGGL